MVENYQVEFELGARLDLCRERAKPAIEAGIMAVSEALFHRARKLPARKSVKP